MATLDGYQTLDFVDDERFDRNVAIFLMAGLPRLAVVTTVPIDDDAPVLPDRLNYWIVLWAQANEGDDLLFHKCITQESVAFLLATAGLARYSLPLWANEESVLKRRELLAGRRMRLAPAQGNIAVMLELVP